MEHKHAEVLRAIADGKEVEFKSRDTGEWVLMHSVGNANPITHDINEWRIKPEPKPPIVVERYVYFCPPVENALMSSDAPNIRFTFDPDTKLPIKVELI